MAGEAAIGAGVLLFPCRPQAFDLKAVEMTAELVRAVGKPAFVLFMGGPQRAPTTYRDAREHIEGSDGVAGMCVDVAHVMLTQRAIYHHSRAQGQTAMKLEPVGNRAEGETGRPHY